MSHFMESMRERIVWIDIDDTIAQTLPEMLLLGTEYLEQRNHECKWNYNVQTEDDLYFVDILQLGDEDIELYFEAYYPKYLEKIIPFENMKKYLNLLHEKGFQINLISSRRKKEGYDIKEITENWLKKNDLSYDNLIVNCMDKGLYLKNERGIFIDDSYQNCKAVSEKTKMFVIQKQTNFSKKCNNTRVIHRYTWKEIIEEIFGLYGIEAEI